MGESRENCIDRRQEPDTETVELLRLIEKYPVVILTLLVSPHIQENTYNDHKTNYIWILVYPESCVGLSDYRIWFVIGRLPWQGVHWVCWRQLYQAKKATMWICVLVWGWHSFRYYRGSVWRMTVDKDTLHKVCMKPPTEFTASGGLFIIIRTWRNY